MSCQQKADEISRLRRALEHVVETFKRDEAQGYRSRDRQFAIEILEGALSVRDDGIKEEET